MPWLKNARDIKHKYNNITLIAGELMRGIFTKHAENTIFKYTALHIPELNARDLSLHQLTVSISVLCKIHLVLYVIGLGIRLNPFHAFLQVASFSSSDTGHIQSPKENQIVCVHI